MRAPVLYLSCKLLPNSILHHIMQGNTLILSYSPHMRVKHGSSGFGGKTKFSQIVMTLDECQKRRRRIDETQPNEALRTHFPLMCAHLFWLEITWQHKKQPAKNTKKPYIVAKSPKRKRNNVLVLLSFCSAIWVLPKRHHWRQHPGPTVVLRHRIAGNGRTGRGCSAMTLGDGSDFFLRKNDKLYHGKATPFNWFR